ncbi:trypsin-like serine protease [Streptococcus acidominimus]|uniref:Trypsin-like serine protease n=1 Tax=Streptococcus acidominimus TaxID=1326 RepID=A0A4Y9FT22_STRAI|nr:trypsin-like serine protease [Streptococcus acidominimus]MBF0847239.1 trypsin-like serine protease [Streptococcus danieliae]MBF0818309.1 trypsin-like serine protease [Streptococcus acidominimus]MBF0838830.1 trypsin-like serine protease [Streptococcus acidominimus]MBF0839538.1 trypsin-like serine protease [Streptococcus acidominimus]TFU31379.1 trypsin-like serine protease [Streptococcus acidominimus]
MKKKFFLFLCSAIIAFTPNLAFAGTRQPVTSREQKAFPYNLTYSWYVTKSDGQTMRSTGTYIGNGKFLSAAHSVTDRYGRYNSSNTAISLAPDLSEHFKVYSQGNNPFKVMPGYAGFNDLKNDISITEITEPISINTDTQRIKLKIYQDLTKLVGKTVETTGYSNFTRTDFTKARGKILSVESDGTLIADLGSATENSGSAVYLNGETIGVLTAITDECIGQNTCKRGTITPLTLDIKQKLLDPNGVPSSVE